MRTSFPQKLNDGQFDYTLVEQSQTVPDGTPGHVATYERVPPDPDYQFTPSLDYVESKTDVPEMLPVKR